MDNYQNQNNAEQQNCSNNTNVNNNCCNNGSQCCNNNNSQQNCCPNNCCNNCNCCCNCNRNNNCCNQNNNIPKRTNTFALVGFIISFFSSIIGLIISVIGYNQIMRNQNTPQEESGKGLAIAGILISAMNIVMFFFLLLLVITFPAIWYV